MPSYRAAIGAETNGGTGVVLRSICNPIVSLTDNKLYILYSADCQY